MRQKVARLATGRAMLAAAIVGFIEAAKHMGAPVPDGAEDLVNVAIDLGIVLVAFLTTASAHHAEKPGA